MKLPTHAMRRTKPGAAARDVKPRAAARDVKPRAAARGAASLLVVMALFFAISMVAAYTGRNLVFEQRTSANQFRAVAAQEASEAAVEWALARLNEGRMGDNCEPLANVSLVNSASPQSSFRQRYLTIDNNTGFISPRGNRLAGCAFDGTRWVCDCPDSGEPNPSFTPSGSGPFPAFWVKFAQPNPSSPTPGAIYVQTNACTRNDPSCLRFGAAAQSGDAVASSWVLLALKTALLTPPTASLTARGLIEAPITSVSTLLTLANTDRAVGGLNVHSGCDARFGRAISAITIAGSPLENSYLRQDGSLVRGLPTPSCPNINAALSTATEAARESFFVGMFGAKPSVLRQQTGMNVLDCSSTCSSAQVNEALLLNPDHPVILTGAGGLHIDGPMGMTAAHPNPVLLIVEGNVTAGPSGSSVQGLVFSQATQWILSGSAQVTGAIVAERDFYVDSGSSTVTYDAIVLSRLRRTTGTFVKVPGGWRDFAAN